MSRLKHFKLEPPLLVMAIKLVSLTRREYLHQVHMTAIVIFKGKEDSALEMSKELALVINLVLKILGQESTNEFSIIIVACPLPLDPNMKILLRGTKM